MFDIATETPIPLAEAVKLIPPSHGGKKTHFSTLLRWILNGVMAPGGNRVRLEAVRLGNRWMTSRPALQRFVEHCTPGIGEAPASSGRRTPGRRQRASERAAKQLSSMGV